MGIASWFGIGKDIKDATDGIGNNVTKIISVAKGKLPPEQQVEVEKIQAEVDTKLSEIRARSEDALKDFIIKYEGSADQVPKGILVWRSAIRPAFTSFFFLQLMIIVGIDVFNVVVHKLLFSQLLICNLPNAWWWMMGIVLTFWFGGRGVERAVEKLQSSNNKT